MIIIKGNLFKIKIILLIKETEKDMIVINRIKNKKELYILSENERLILNKIREFNKEGFFNNIRAEYQDTQILLKSTNNI